MAGRGVLVRIREIALSLPETTEKPFGGHSAPSFRVRDKMFAVVSEDHAYLTLKAPPGAQKVLIESDPNRFFFPKYVGSKGWVGVHLDRASSIDWDEIEELIMESYTLIAPKRLVAQWEATLS